MNIGWPRRIIEQAASPFRLLMRGNSRYRVTLLTWAWGSPREARTALTPNIKSQFTERDENRCLYIPGSRRSRTGANDSRCTGEGP
jgi:hypothetical protein